MGKARSFGKPCLEATQTRRYLPTYLATLMLVLGPLVLVVRRGVRVFVLGLAVPMLVTGPLVPVVVRVALVLLLWLAMPVLVLGPARLLFRLAVSLPVLPPFFFLPRACCASACVRPVRCYGGLKCVCARKRAWFAFACAQPGLSPFIFGPPVLPGGLLLFLCFLLCCSRCALPLARSLF